jgi:hypothetical protein
MNRRLALVVGALATAVVTLAGCGGSGSSPTTTPTTPAAGGGGTASTPTSNQPADPEGAKAQITTTWTTFFNSKTPSAAAIGLLQDGSSLGKALAKAMKEDKANGGNRSAKVKKIEFTSPTQANVTYLLHAGGTTLNSSGVAVQANGKWLVSRITFCTLVVLGNGEKPVAGCGS